MNNNKCYVTLVDEKLARALSAAYTDVAVEEQKAQGLTPMVSADPLFYIPAELFGRELEIQVQDYYGVDVLDDNGENWSIPWMFIQRMEEKN